MGRYEKINPFGTIAEEEVVKSEIQHVKKKAVSAQAPMEEKDVEVSAPMSADDVKEAWRNYRERRKVKKEARLKQ